MIKEILMSSNYWVLNKSMVKEFGIETAFILTNLVEAENILSDEDGWFYQTADTLEALTGMSNHKQTVAIKQLIDCGVIIHKNKGIPMKRYFKISFEKIQELAFKNIKNCNLKNSKTSIEEFSNNKEITNKANNKEITNKERIASKLTKTEIAINTYTTNLDLHISITDFITMRKTIKKPMTDKAIELLFKNLNKLATNDSEKIEILNQSIMNCYQGIFAIKQEGSNGNFRKDNTESKGKYAGIKVKDEYRKPLTDREIADLNLI